MTIPPVERRQTPRRRGAETSYLLIVAVLTFVATRDPNDFRPRFWMVACVVCLPALIPMLPVLYLAGSAAFNLSETGAGGHGWPVTATYVVVMTLAAMLNVALARAVTSRRRNSAGREPFASNHSYVCMISLMRGEPSGRTSVGARSPIAPLGRWYAAWSSVGAVSTLALLSLMSIGVFLIPFAVAGWAALLLKPAARPAMVAVVSGFGLPVLYIAFLNRDGPGTVCRARSGGQSCLDEWSPWPFLAVGGILVLGGALAAVLVARQGSGAVGPWRAECPD